MSGYIGTSPVPQASQASDAAGMSQSGFPHDIVWPNKPTE